MQHKVVESKTSFLGSKYIRNTAVNQCAREIADGAPRKTNEPYAIAKIAGIKMCEAINRQFVMKGLIQGSNANKFIW